MLLMKDLCIAFLIAVLPFSATAQSSNKGASGGAVVVMEGHPIEFVARDRKSHSTFWKTTQSRLRRPQGLRGAR